MLLEGLDTDDGRGATSVADLSAEGLAEMRAWATDHSRRNIGLIIKILLRLYS